MATTMVGLGHGGPGFHSTHLFTVTKASGSGYSKKKFVSPQVQTQVRVFPTLKGDNAIDFNRSLFKKLEFGDDPSVTQKLINYMCPSYQPNKLSRNVMQLFGFDPKDPMECPLIQPPSIDQIGQLVKAACPVKGTIYTGAVNLTKEGPGDKHFYIVAANTGNVNKIAALLGMPPEKVRRMLTAPLTVLAQWAGSMMAGGGSIQINKDGERALLELAREEMDRLKMENPKVVIGKGDLTVGHDQVELSRPGWVEKAGATLFSFMARTMYFHALSGSVLHMQYVSETGDIFWIWIGAGGKGFNSKELNNFTAIDLDLGIWPDLAKSLMAFYENPELLEAFANGKPEDFEELIKKLVTASQEKRGSALSLIQHMLVTMGYATRVSGVVKNGAFEVKGKQ
jgi:hypothetical protein